MIVRVHVDGNGRGEMYDCYTFTVSGTTLNLFLKDDIDGFRTVCFPLARVSMWLVNREGESA